MCNVMCNNDKCYLCRTHFLWCITFASYLWSVVVIEKVPPYYLFTEYENGAASQIITPMPFPQSNEIIIICVCVCLHALLPNASSLNSQHMMFLGGKRCIPTLPYNLDNGGGKGDVRKLIKSIYFLSL